jgi:hypothetical protein
VDLYCYDHKANKPVSENSKGIKKIDRLIKSGQLKILWEPPNGDD